MPKKLSDTAMVILSAAAARDSLQVLPLPTQLRTPANIVVKVLEGLIAEGYLAEVAVAQDESVWRRSDMEAPVGLIITQSGLRLLGVEHSTGTMEQEASHAATQARTDGTSSELGTSPQVSTRATRGGDTKQAIVVALLRRGNGASIEEMMAATGWQAHSVRGFMSGPLKKKLGIDVVSEKDAAGTRRYHVAAICT